MAYDETLELRIRQVIGADPELTKKNDFVVKKMFGGLCVLFNGNMACGVIEDTVIARVGPDAYEEAMSQPHTRIFDFTGRPMKGWVTVEPEGIADDDALRAWLDRGIAYALSFPPKAPKSRKPRKKAPKPRRERV